MYGTRIKIKHYPEIIYLVVPLPYSGLHRLIVEVSRSYSDTPHSVGILWTSNRAVTETSICKKHNFHNTLTSIPPVGFDPAIPSREQPQTHALERVEAGIGILKFAYRKQERHEEI